MYDPNEAESGYIIDLDCAERVLDVETKTKLTRQPSLPVGTKAFLSIDLCTDGPVLHLYRHDLESLFYVLAWVVTRYRDGKRNSSNAFTEWETGEWETIKKQKRAMFSSGYKYPEETLMVDNWLVPLGELFGKGYAARDQALAEGTLADFDDETLGGHISYDAFYSILLE